MLNPSVILLARKRSIKKALQSGAVIIDIREPRLFDAGHVEGSINIPKGLVKANINKLLQIKAPLLVCSTHSFHCLSTVAYLRSCSLQAANGGNWYFVQKIKRDLDLVR